MGSTRQIGSWAVLVSILVGLAAGTGAYTFRYARGLSYFSTDPRACVNCHIMQPQYDSWQKASHHTVAVCIDCHLPVEFVPKYLAKAENGYRHAEKFTTQDFVEPIVVQRAGQEILQANCVRCHEGLVHDIVPSDAGEPSMRERDSLACVHCHAGAGHGERASLGGPLSRDESIDADGQDRPAHGI